jgi:ankyrin repeat protein
MLVVAKAEVAVQNLEGRTALQVAESRGHTNVVEILRVANAAITGTRDGYSQSTPSTPRPSQTSEQPYVEYEV